jgi:hypothetical protein
MYVYSSAQFVAYTVSKQMMLKHSPDRTVKMAQKIGIVTFIIRNLTLMIQKEASLRSVM